MPTASGLFILDFETGILEEPKTGSTQVYVPAWSLSGEAIAFTNYLDGHDELCSIKPDGSDIPRLTDSPGSDAHCGWASDGAWIAITSGLGGFQKEAPMHPYNTQPYGNI